MVVSELMRAWTYPAKPTVKQCWKQELVLQALISGHQRSSGGTFRGRLCIDPAVRLRGYLSVAQQSFALPG